MEELISGNTTLAEMEKKRFNLPETTPVRFLGEHCIFCCFHCRGCFQLHHNCRFYRADCCAVLLRC